MEILVVALGAMLLVLEVVGLLVVWYKLDCMQATIDSKMDVVQTYAEEGQTTCKAQRRIAEATKTAVQEAKAVVEEAKIAVQQVASTPNTGI